MEVPRATPTASNKGFFFAPDERRALTFIICVDAILQLVAAASASTVLAASWSSSGASQQWLPFWFAMLFTPAMALFAIAFAAAWSRVGDDQMSMLWTMLVLGLPLTRIAPAVVLPGESLQMAFKVIYTRSATELSQAALMLAGMIHAVVLHQYPRSYKLRILLANYVQEFVLLGLGFARLRGDSIASRAEKVTLPIESWIYFSDSSKYFLFTDFPKCVPFLLGLCVTEVALHLVDLKWQLHLNAAAAQASETDRFQREALRLRHEIRQLEASKRRVLNQMSMNMQRARQERQLLTAASRTGQLPPIDESEQKPRGSAKESRGRTSPLLLHQVNRIVQPGPADIAPDIEYDEKWSGPWMPEPTMPSAALWSANGGRAGNDASDAVPCSRRSDVKRRSGRLSFGWSSKKKK